MSIPEGTEASTLRVLVDAFRQGSLWRLRTVDRCPWCNARFHTYGGADDALPALGDRISHCFAHRPFRPDCTRDRSRFCQVDHLGDQTVELVLRPEAVAAIADAAVEHFEALKDQRSLWLLMVEWALAQDEPDDSRLKTLAREVRAEFPSRPERKATNA